MLINGGDLDEAREKSQLDDYEPLFKKRFIDL